MKLLGCILLIVGTCVGAGILGLPIATATLGFSGSVGLLIVSWLIMMTAAFLILEASLWLPQNSNLISMAKATLGPLGQVIAWIVYVLLLYSLLCAYVAGGSSLFHNVLLGLGITLSPTLAAVLFTLIFGAVVFCGIRSVDYVNRGLMAAKFVAYVLLIIFLAPFVKHSNLMTSHLSQLTAGTALTVTITAFGYSTIIPSLRIYFENDVKKIKLAILIGSTIPLIVYLIWDAAIMGVIPLAGFTQIANSSDSTAALVHVLSGTVNISSVTVFTKIFTSICVLTSFLGVALCIADFLSDGLQIAKKGWGNVFVHLLTLVPPLVIVLFFPNIFIKALVYAGVDSIILLVFLPIAMVWRGRYHKQMTASGVQFSVPGGRPVLLIMFLVAAYIVVRGVMSL